jgi:hypothetical protein
MVESRTTAATGETDTAVRSLMVVVAVLGAITVLRLAVLAYYRLDLYPDEAQYWSWSRELAFGYFSKPPVIAWLIAATTAVCGAGEGCIKASIPLLYFVTSLLIYGIGRRLYSGTVGFLAALAFITLPGVSYSAVIASTDPPLLACWALATYALVRLAQGEARGLAWWIVLGAATGLGLLSKYAMAFFLIGLTLWIAFDGEARRRLVLSEPGGWRRLGLGLAITGAIYVPNVLWNIRSHFVTFTHTGGNANLRGELFHPNHLLDFAASQFGVFGPVLFTVLLLAMFRVARWRADWRTRLFAALVLPMLGSITVLALLSRANANWAAPVYIAGTVWVTAALVEGGRRWLAVASLALHMSVAAAVTVLPVLRDGPGTYAGLRFPRGLDPFIHYDGWREIGAAVSAIRARFPTVPLLVDDRKLLAELLYYVRPWPEDIYSWLPDGRIGDHFDLTRPLPVSSGGDYVFVTHYDDPRYILRHFRDFAVLEAISVPIAPRRARRVWVFHVRGFLGYKAPRMFYEGNPLETRKGQTEQ